MSIIVFTGPTIAAAEARQDLEATYLPPVSQGDVYRACAKGPRMIAIIDGYFERVPSVWHKEILWAMNQGIHVFGSSSMGALRAAELHTFGMEGVGVVFEAFRDGVIEDDDEVAVAHASADAGFRATSDAMVNIRQTLSAATARRVIAASTRDALVDVAKALFYPERVYPAILAAGLARGLPSDEIAALRAFLPQGRINQKREDARLLLRTLRHLAEQGLARKVVDYKFESTEFWQRAEQTAGDFAPPERETGPAAYHTVTFDGILDELRLDPDAYRQAMAGAMLRHLTMLEAGRRGMTVDTDALERTSDAFRRRRGLYRPEDVQAWMREFNLDWTAFVRLLKDEALCAWVEKAIEEISRGRLRDHLTVSGGYAKLAAAARAKQRRLEQAGIQNPGMDATSLTEADLVRWYFEHCARTPVPADVGPALRAAGFTDVEEFTRIVLREYLHRALAGVDTTSNHVS